MATDKVDKVNADKKKDQTKLKMDVLGRKNVF